jgi:hypothetical protein
MSRLAYMLLLLLLYAAPVLAQAPNRGAELDKAVEEARAAYIALQDAERRRETGVTPETGERQATAAGATRPTEQYLGRQLLLEQEVELARRRYEAAMKRWNDLK